MTKIKTRTIGIVALLLAFVLSLPLFGFGCMEYASDYTEQEHYERVLERAKARYIDSGKYTDLEVFPLYDENDKLTHFVIELQPSGHVYVRINERNERPFLGAGLYTRCEYMEWQRYRLSEDGQEPTPMEGIQLQRDTQNRYCEIDEQGEFVVQTNSPYRVAGITTEKRYLLGLNKISYKIPAIRKGEKYLNLVSMQKIEYTNLLNTENCPYQWMMFTGMNIDDL